MGGTHGPQHGQRRAHGFLSFRQRVDMEQGRRQDRTPAAGHPKDLQPGGGGRDKILVHQRQSGPAHPRGAGLHAGRTFFRGARHQGIETDSGAGPVPDPKVERVAAPGGLELPGVFFYPEGKTPQ